jgi:hypothetical protein
VTLSLIYLIIVTILLTFSSIFSYLGDKSDREAHNQGTFKKRFKIFIILAVLIFVFTILQYIQNGVELSNKEKEANTQQWHRDSILSAQYNSSLYVMKQKYDSSHQNIVLTIANTLGKYGLRLDSTNQNLIKLIKDSSKTKVILPIDPILTVCPDGILLNDQKNNIHHYELQFCSDDAGSSKFDIKSYVIIADTLDNLYYVGTNTSLISYETKIPTNTQLVAYFDVINPSPYSILYIYLKGNYKNIDGTKSYNIDIIYWYNKNTKRTGIMMGKTRSSIIDFINNSLK